jgi:hypothetical protein
MIQPNVWRTRLGHERGCPCDTCVGINAFIEDGHVIDQDEEETWFGYLNPKDPQNPKEPADG